MKVFLSWSGNRSKAVAEIFREWLRCVIQSSRPWMSARDIDRGAVWFSELAEQLRETSIGIICLTQDNKEKPWILFEAGALAKGLTSSRVCTFLVDLTPTDLKDPLAQFNHTFAEKSSVLSLVKTINSLLGDAKLEDQVLEKVFNTYWPQFEQSLKKALTDNPPESQPVERDEQSYLAEILEAVRSIRRRLSTIEDKIESNDSSIGVSIDADNPYSSLLKSAGLYTAPTNKPSSKRSLKPGELEKAMSEILMETSKNNKNTQ